MGKCDLCQMDFWNKEEGNEVHESDHVDEHENEHHHEENGDNDDAEVFSELAQTWRKLELESTTVFQKFCSECRSLGGIIRLLMIMKMAITTVASKYKE